MAAPAGNKRSWRTCQERGFRPGCGRDL